MRYMLRITVGFALLVACISGRAVTKCAWAADAARGASAKAAASSGSAAEKLVREALEAELAGNAVERARLVEAALKEDPELAAARWQSGQIKVGKAWLTVDEAAQSHAENARLAEYRRRRDVLISTAGGERELARWCQRSQLTDEAAVHWQAVLSFVPNDSEAIRALKLKLHNGKLLSPRELASAQARAARERAATRVWRAKVEAWRDTLLAGDPVKRQGAVDGLKSIRDPDAIPLLETMLVKQARAGRAGDLNATFIDVLAQMPEEASTQALLRQVLTGDAQLAARALKGRPLSSFVPQLIEALPAKVEISGKTLYEYSPLGIVAHEHQVTISIPEKNYTDTLVRRHTEIATGPGALTVLNGRLQEGQQDAKLFEDGIENQQRLVQQQLETRRGKIEQALQIATGFEPSDTIDGWWDQYEGALDVYSSTDIPSQLMPSQYRQFETTRLTILQPSPEPAGPTTQARQAPDPNAALPMPWKGRVVVNRSCFCAGTLVETQLGPASIETLKPGDRVLSQDVETGELAYQAVREVTLRPAVPLVEIEAGGQSIQATRGHPFWVNGQGWVMAKHLKAGQYLHTPDGPLQIERIGEQPAQEAYNLVVSDFATYFVGEQKILVHDNQPIEGSSMLVPGLAARDVTSQTP